VTPVMIQTAHGEGKPGGVQRWGMGAKDATGPVNTITVQGGGGQAVATAYLAQMNGGPRESTGHDIRKPSSTILNSGSHQQLVTAQRAHLRGNCDARNVDDPLMTVSAGGQHHGLVTAHMLAMGQNAMGHDLLDPAQTVMAGAPRYGVVECELSPDDEA